MNGTSIVGGGTIGANPRVELEGGRADCHEPHCLSLGARNDTREFPR